MTRNDSDITHRQTIESLKKKLVLSIVAFIIVYLCYIVYLLNIIKRSLPLPFLEASILSLFFSIPTTCSFKFFQKMSLEKQLIFLDDIDIEIPRCSHWDKTLETGYYVRFNQVKKLKISLSSIESIPETIVCLKNLSEINLSDNNLNIFP